MNTKKMTILALSITLALILSYVESLIPPLAAIPGVKVGLPNIVVVFVLYKLGWKEALGISFLRVILVSMLFGTGASFLYSAAGAILSFTGMILLKKSGLFSHIAVSVAGGVLHNVGQIAMACLILQTDVLRFYLPVLILSGVIAGIAVGILSSLMVSRIRIDSWE